MTHYAARLHGPTGNLEMEMAIQRAQPVIEIPLLYAPNWALASEQTLDKIRRATYKFSDQVGRLDDGTKLLRYDFADVS